MTGPYVALHRSDAMPYDADYYRARAIEERGHAAAADVASVAAIHRELAERLDGLAAQCDGFAEEFDVLVEQASQSVKKRER